MKDCASPLLVSLQDATISDLNTSDYSHLLSDQENTVESFTDAVAAASDVLQSLNIVADFLSIGENSNCGCSFQNDGDLYSTDYEDDGSLAAELTKLEEIQIDLAAELEDADLSDFLNVEGIINVKKFTGFSRQMQKEIGVQREACMGKSRPARRRRLIRALKAEGKVLPQKENLNPDDPSVVLKDSSQSTQGVKIFVEDLPAVHPTTSEENARTALRAMTNLFNYNNTCRNNTPPKTLPCVRRRSKHQPQHTRESLSTVDLDNELRENCDQLGRSSSLRTWSMRKKEDNFITNQVCTSKDATIQPNEPSYQFKRNTPVAVAHPSFGAEGKWTRRGCNNNSKEQRERSDQRNQTSTGDYSNLSDVITEAGHPKGSVVRPPGEGKGRRARERKKQGKAQNLKSSWSRDAK